MGTVINPSNVASVRDGSKALSHLDKVLETCVRKTHLLSQSISEFWGLPVQLRCFSVSPENLYFWRLEEYFVSQLALDTHPQKIAQLRVSDGVCSALLTQVLGPRAFSEQSFRFNRLTRFEAELLNHFSRDLFSALVKGELVKKQLPKPKRVHLVHVMWLFKIDQPDVKDYHSIGKIVLTLPVEAIPLDEELGGIFETEVSGLQTLSDQLLGHAHVLTELAVGKTRIRLEEIQHLEAGDIVVLQESASNRLWVQDPQTGAQFPFTAESQYRHKIEVPYTQEMAMIEEQNNALKQNLWDNLMIDVSAEFFPTKIPLNHLKHMTEGLVVEIGDLIHNQIRLHVEGKTVALGELVIVGDKFGVRVKQVGEEKNSEPEGHKPHLEAKCAATKGVESPSYEEENFHSEASPEENTPIDEVDEFLNDDFDSEAFDEDEEW